MSQTIDFAKPPNYFENSLLEAALLGSVCKGNNGGGAKNRNAGKGGAVLLSTSSAVLPQPHTPEQRCFQ